MLRTGSMALFVSVSRPVRVLTVSYRVRAMIDRLFRLFRAWWLYLLPSRAPVPRRRGRHRNSGMNGVPAAMVLEPRILLDAVVDLTSVAADQAEGLSGTTSYTFDVAIDSIQAADVTLDFAVTGTGPNPATGDDFVGGSLPAGQVTITAGNLSTTLTIEVAADSTVELDESFEVTLSSPPAGVTIGTATATGTIQNDDSASVSITGATVDENAGTLDFTVVLTNPVDTDVDAVFATADGTAMWAAGDYTPFNESITIPADSTGFVFSVPINDDTSTEGNEEFEGRIREVSANGRDVTLAFDGAFPFEMGTVSVPGPVFGNDLVGNLLYGATGNAGLTITDVSNPNAPTLVGSLVLPGAFAGDVQVVGNLAYVAGGGSGLFVVDVSNPAAPSQVGFYNTPGFSRAVFVEGNLAYVADTNQLQIIDVSVPAAPTPVGFINTPQAADNVFVSGNLAYVADGSSGLRIVDVSNPAAPFFTGFYFAGGWAADVHVVGNLAYVANRNNGLEIIDVSTPSAPTLVGSFPTNGAEAVSVDGDYATLVSLSGTFEIIDVSNPASPTSVSLLGGLGGLRDVQVEDGFSYVASQNNRQFIVNNAFSATATGTIVDNDNPTTTVSISGSDLLIQDTNGGDSDDQITITTDGVNITIHDPNNVIQTLIPGATGAPSRTVHIPVSAFTGNIIVDTLGGDDTLTVDFSDGNFSNAIQFAGGTQGGTGDALTLTGGSTFASATYTYLSESDGSVDVSGNSTISYTGLEPITSSISATDVILNYSAAAETVTVSSSGSQTQVDSSFGEITTFANPTGSLTINTGDGADLVQVHGLGAGFAAALNINGQGDIDTVNLESSINPGSVNVQADTINVTADLTVTGTGTIDLIADRDVVINNNANVSTIDGNLTISAHQGATAAGSFAGITISDAIVSTESGDISLTGTGGAVSASGVNHGVLIHSTAVVTSTGVVSGNGAGTITITGTAGESAAGTTGVLINTGASVDSIEGDITIVGMGSTGTAGSANMGVRVAGGAVVTSNGSGVDAADISITGTGGEGLNANVGVRFDGAGTQVTTSDGNVLVTGTGGGSGTGLAQHGVHVVNGAMILASGSGANAGNITLDGTAGSGLNINDGVVVQGVGSRVAVVGGDISITGQGGIGTAPVGFNIGVYVGNDGVVDSIGTGPDAGTITIDGTGGQNGPGNLGVQITSGGRIASADGDIQLTGAGGSGVGEFQRGIEIISGTVESTGTGADAANITINATGGSGTSINTGFNVANADGFLRTVDGDILITGQGGTGTDPAGANNGVVVNNGGSITSSGTGPGAGTITVNGTGGSGGDANLGIQVQNSGAFIESVDGDISLTGIAGSGDQFNLGVEVRNTGVVRSTGTGADAATITIDGTGGDGLTINSGVALNNGTVTSVDGDIDVTGVGGDGSGDFHQGIVLNADATISSTGTGAGAADITLTGTGGNAVGGNHGVQIGGANALVTAVDGQITVTGIGRGSGNFTHGVVVFNGGVISSTGIAGAGIDITGTGEGTADTSMGVDLFSNGTITSLVAPIHVEGTGSQSATGPGSRGVFVASGSVISSTGTGPGAATISITGTGGTGTFATHGVDFNDGSATTVDGDITIDGTGGSGSTFSPAGVVLLNGGTVSSTGSTANAGNIDVTGTGGTGGTGTGPGVFVFDATSGFAADAGTVNLQGAGSASVVEGFVTSSTGTVTVGSDANVIFGDAAVVTGVSQVSAANRVQLTGDVTFNGDLDLAASVVHFDAAGTLPGTEHDQIVVTGAGRTVDLSGTTLDLTGTFMPAPGESIVLIDLVDASSSVTGTFNGLAEGDILIMQGAPLTITYQGGTDNNDVVLSRRFIIGDQVWNDLDNDGIRQEGESGLDDVVVRLLDAGGSTELAQTTTADGGRFALTGIEAGTYIVEIDAPLGFDFAPQDQGSDDSIDSDVNAVGRVTVTVGTVEKTFVDAGLVFDQTTGSISDTVWLDQNANGLRDAGEAGIDGITVNLLDATGTNVLATRTTETGGQYFFTGLAAGSYLVEFATPPGYSFTLQDQGSDDAIDSDPDPGTGRVAVTLAAGQDLDTVDAGMTFNPNTGTIGDRVWNDYDSDGIQDAGEAGRAGVTVNLLDSGGSVIASTTTDDFGDYLFTGLPAGAFTVEFVAPGGFRFTTADAGGDDSLDSDTDEFGRVAVTLALAETTRDLDAGLVFNPNGGTIGSRVWDDQNGNGIQDTGEAGVDGVKVLLQDVTGSITIDSTITANGGLYEFTGLSEGDYSLLFLPPSGYSFSVTDAGSDDTVDSDADASGRVAVSLAAGEQLRTIDAGVAFDRSKASISDFVWRDANGNGIQDRGEKGIRGVQVNLRDVSRRLIAQTVTRADGSYAFHGLESGTYYVQVVRPVGRYVPSPANQGTDDSRDSDADASGYMKVVVAANQQLQSADAGFVYGTVATEITGTIWSDTNSDGVRGTGERVISNNSTVYVRLYNETGKLVDSQRTTYGAYKFSGLADGTYTVDVDARGYLFSPQDAGFNDALDSDVDAKGRKTVTVSSGQKVIVDGGVTIDQSLGSIGDRVWNDLNANGIQDEGEPGVDGVKVLLLDRSGAIVATDVTERGGRYTFTGLAQGDYEIQVLAPSGHDFSLADQGTNDSLDSDVDLDGRFSVTVGANQKIVGADAGLIFDETTGSIGSRVFRDLNSNGIQDTGEPGLEGVTVQLLDGAGNVIAETTTIEDGRYRFPGLSGGTWTVRVIAPTGFDFSAADQGTDDSLDSDVDDRGQVDVTIVDGQDDDTVDAGLTFAPAGEIGSRVWQDLNGNGIQDPGEPGRDGVTVLLLDPAGEIVDETTTADGGRYLFSGLPEGTYQVQVLAPLGHIFPAADQGGDDLVDSDVDDRGLTEVTLALNESNLTVDAGVFFDVNTASIGSLVWSDLNEDGVQDTGEPGLADVEVVLQDLLGNEVARTTTDAEGRYEFTGLSEGTYVVAVTAPRGYAPTVQDAAAADEATDSDVAGDGTVEVVLGLNENNSDIDAGMVFTPAGEIGDFVWRDRNANGIQDANETGIDGVGVVLLDAAGRKIASTRTKNKGRYQFTGLAEGTYTVRVLPPSGFGFVAADVGSNDQRDSDFNVLTGEASVTITGVEQNFSLDAGLTFDNSTSSIGDVIWFDRNANGRRDAGEYTMKNVAVILRDTSGRVIQRTLSDARTGSYSFSGLSAGSYIVDVTAPRGYAFTTQDAAGTNESNDSDADLAGRMLVTVGVQQRVVTVDAGLIIDAGTAKISGRAWHDLNNDGILLSGEPTLENVKVVLRDTSGKAIATQLTGAGGSYTFSGLAAGVYTVDFINRAGQTFSPQDVAAAGDFRDSDVDAKGRVTIPLTVGQKVGGVNAGLHFDFNDAVIGNTVWRDLNGDGIQNTGEAGLGGVTVVLTDQGGQEIDTVTTTADGRYQFTGLAGGKYVVQVIAPQGFVHSPANQGSDDEVDNDFAEGGPVTVSLIPGQAVSDLDAGLIFIPAAEISDRVWLDVNADGIQDSGESGIDDLDVTLLDDALNVLEETTTADGGLYRFTGLAAGTYFVRFTTSAGFEFTTADVGTDDAVDSDADVDGLVEVTLTDGQLKSDVDAGLSFIPAGEIGSRVWDDINANGVQDAGEVGLDGIRVLLLDERGEVVGEQKTADGGLYRFTGLGPGDYTVQVVAPRSFEFTLQDEGTDDAVDSDVGADGTVVLTLTQNEISDSIDAGLRFVPSGVISDRVWHDLDADGIQESGEPGLDGITVELRDASGQVIDTAVTDNGGRYAFTGLPAATYTVRVVAPLGYVIAPQNSGTNDVIDSDIDTLGEMTVTLTSEGQYIKSADAGLVFDTNTGSISDFVWYDQNSNGVFDGRERGRGGVIVVLRDASGREIKRTKTSSTTGSAGKYSFKGLAAGDYSVEVVAPRGYGFSPQDVGPSDSRDSDADALGRIPVSLNVGQRIVTADAGLVLDQNLASITARVWEDLDEDGIQDKGEYGVGGVTVLLLDQSGRRVASAVTQKSGVYTLSRLPGGTHTVQFLAPRGRGFTLANQGTNDALDSDVDSAGRVTVVLAANQRHGNIDAGVVFDTNTSSIGDTVWRDLNGDGIQDVGEPGLDGVKVALLDQSNRVIATTVTANDGQYEFSGLASGTYVVQVNAPRGYDFTTQDQGTDDALDSDFDDTGRATVTVGVAEDVSDVDAGLIAVPAAEIGDRVWHDLNGDGVQDAGEPGLDDLTVQLFDVADNLIDETVTADGGRYQFAGLAAGTYTVRVSPAAGFEFAPADAASATDFTDSDFDDTGAATVTIGTNEVQNSIDAGLVFTAAGSIGNRVWRDQNSNGIQDADERGLKDVAVTLFDDSGTVIDRTVSDEDGRYQFNGLVAGTYTVRFAAPRGFDFSPADQGIDDAVDSDVSALGSVDVVLTTDEENQSVDAGLIFDQSLGVISDSVWHDLNGDGIRTEGEPGLANVTVALVDKSRRPLQVTRTDADGRYRFTGLGAGTWYVRVTRPNGYTFSPANQGTDDTVDSDFNGTGTAKVLLTANQTNDTIDAGLVYSATTGVISDRVWYDLNGDGVQDAGEPGYRGVTIVLMDSVGKKMNSVTTDRDGRYAFTGLSAGTYKLRAIAPTGTEFSPVDAAAATDDTDSDVDANGAVLVTVGAGQFQTNIDVGLVTQTSDISIGNRVWYDADGDGIQDTGEKNLQGTSVVLYDASGNIVVAKTQTDELGEYLFSGLAAGSYIVEVRASAGFIISPQNVGADDTVDSDADPTTGRVNVTVGAGDQLSDIDVGVTRAPSQGAIGSIVWFDSDGDGIRESGELGAPNVAVRLFDASGKSELQTTKTDANGRFTFTGLAAGTYVVEFARSSKHLFSPQDQGTADQRDSDADPSTGRVTVTLAAGEKNLNVDAGLLPPPAAAQVIGRVWKDADKDGTRDAKELGERSVRVDLLDFSGKTKIRETKTDQYGNYAFTGLDAGTYTILVVPPTGQGFTSQNVGNDSVDSDVDTKGRSVPLTVAAGAKVKVDAGLAGGGSRGGTGNGTASIGNLVWNDKDQDGRRDKGENGLAGVTVNLFDNRRLLKTTTTNSKGEYLFTGLAQGTYTVVFVPRGGYQFSPANVGSDYSDSDVDSKGRVVVTTSALSKSTVHAGLFHSTASIGDRVWQDLDGDGVQDAGEPGMANVTVELLDEDGVTILDTTTTDEFGFYDFGFSGTDGAGDYRVRVVAPLGFEFTTLNAGTDDERDSDFDPLNGEAAVTLASEQIISALDAGLVRRTDSDLGSISNFVWNDLNGNGIQDAGEPGVDDVSVVLIDSTTGIAVAETTTRFGGFYAFHGLAAGTYDLLFVSPAGFDFVTADQGTDDALDSDVDAVTGTTSVTLTAGEHNTSIDAGVAHRTSGDIGVIGDRVWFDTDGDGVQDAGEPGVAGVVVRLRDDGDGSLVDETTTDSNGDWSFAGLPLGTYVVEVAAPGGFDFTSLDQGTDDSLDSDIDPLSSQSAPIVLAAGQQNLDVDAGLVVATTGDTGRISDTVFLDGNGNGIQDPGESGLADVDVLLIDPETLQPLSSTQTDASGQYEFGGLAAGDYRVLVLPGVGFAWTQQDQGTDDTLDSDVSAVSGLSDTITLTAGEQNSTIDAGLIALPPARVPVSAIYSHLIPGDDPDGAGPLQSFGFDAFATFNGAVAGLDRLPDSTIFDLAGESFGDGAVNVPGRIMNVDATTPGVQFDSLLISGGSVLLDGEIDVSGTVTIASGGLLGGTAIVNGSIDVDGGTLAPGFSPGTMSSGDVHFMDNSSFDVEFGGASAGDYDQLDVTGTVNIGTNVALNLASFASYTPLGGEVFTILANDLADSVAGTFAGLAEGAVLSNFLGSGLAATLSYQGGDGNDVTLSVNTAPIARDDDVSTSEDSSLLINVLSDNGNGADSDADGNLDPTLTISLTSPSAGVLTNNNDGTFTFNPNGDFEALDDGDSTTVSFDYQIEDTLGATSSATVTITVNGANDDPMAVADTAGTTENTAVTVDVLGNDTDVDGDDSPANFTLDSVSIDSTTGLYGSPGAAGTVSIVANQLVFDPGTDFDELDDGDTATVVVNYTMSDDSGAPSSGTATITVTGENDGPTAVSDTDTTTENAGITVDVLANDLDADLDDVPATFSLDSVSIASTTGLSGSPAAAGSVSIVANQLVFDPGTDFDELKSGDSATVTIDYTMSDDSGAPSSSTLVLTVTGLNDAPLVVTNTGTSLAQGASVTITTAMLHADDVDDGSGELTYAITTAPVNGTIHLNGSPLTSGQTFTQDDIDNNRVTYVHDGSATTMDSLAFELADGGEDGAGPVAGTFALTITSAGNDAPVISSLTLEGIIDDTGKEGETLHRTVDLSASGDDAIVGQELILTGVFTDSDLTDAHTVTVDWGDGTVEVFDIEDVDLNDDGRSFELRHTYTTADAYAISVDVNDGTDTGSDVLNVGVSDWSLQDGVLAIAGTDGNDAITVKRRSNGEIKVKVRQENGTSSTFSVNLADVSEIMVLGRGGDDVIAISHALSLDSVLDGGNGDDLIFGGRGNDKMIGGAGNDILIGRAGNDIILGGQGHDFIKGNHGDDCIEGGEGNDLIASGSGEDTVSGGDGVDVIYGQNQDDVIYGNDGNDWIFGGNGDDTIYGGAGDDFLSGGNGADTIFGGAGNDIILGGNGADLLIGEDGNDMIFGGNGSDTIEGGDGSDFIHGGAGADTIDGGAGDDIIFGGLGRDDIEGGAGSDLIFDNWGWFWC